MWKAQGKRKQHQVLITCLEAEVPVPHQQDSQTPRTLKHCFRHLLRCSHLLESRLAEGAEEDRLKIQMRLELPAAAVNNSTRHTADSAGNTGPTAHYSLVG